MYAIVLCVLMHICACEMQLEGYLLNYQIAISLIHLFTYSKNGIIAKCLSAQLTATASLCHRKTKKSGAKLSNYALDICGLSPLIKMLLLFVMTMKVDELKPRM